MLVLALKQLQFEHTTCLLENDSPQLEKEFVYNKSSDPNFRLLSEFCLAEAHFVRVKRTLAFKLS